MAAKEAIESRKTRLESLMQKRVQVEETAKTKGIVIPKFYSAVKSDVHSIDNVVNAMSEVERAQAVLIGQREKIKEKEAMRIDPNGFNKTAHKRLEGAFYEKHTAFEAAFNKAHSEEYFRTQKMTALISRLNDGYEAPPYNRDVLDEQIARKAYENGVGTKYESFAQTIASCRYYKGEFANRYVDSKLFINQTGKVEPSPLGNIEMMPVAVKNAITANGNIINAFRAPKSKEEQALINVRIKAAIATNNEEMVQFIDEMKIEKALASQELALENSRLKLGEMAETAFRLQQQVVEKRENRQILLDCGNDLSAKDLKTMDKQSDMLDKIVNTIDKKLDSILTFNKMDKEDYWAQIEMNGKERYKESFGDRTPVPLPAESLLTTIQRSKGEIEVKAFKQDEVVEEKHIDTEVPTRRKTDIVKRAIEAERNRRPRELSPDPAGKQLSREQELDVNVLQHNENE